MSKAKVLESENGDLKVQLQSLNRKVKSEEDNLKKKQVIYICYCNNTYI